jgi:hypothetical protein
VRLYFLQVLVYPVKVGSIAAGIPVKFSRMKLFFETEV